MINKTTVVPNLTPNNIAILQRAMTDVNNQSLGLLYKEYLLGDMDYGKILIMDDGDGNYDVQFKTGKGNVVSLAGGTSGGTSPTSGTVIPSLSTRYIKDSDKDTIANTEESADEDKIRFDAGGTEIAVIDSVGLSLTNELSLVLDGLGGDTYIKYNDTSDYMEFYINGIKRLEL
jgi:hypothetical protein